MRHLRIGLIFLSACAADTSAVGAPAQGNTNGVQPDAASQDASGQIPEQTLTDAPTAQTPSAPTDTQMLADPATAVPAPSADANAPRPSAGCGQTLPAGVNSLSLEFGGETRTHDIYVPASYDADTPVPLLLNLHPLTLGGLLHGIWTSESGLNPKAEAEGFVLAQPDGTGLPASWNAGQDCCAPASTNAVDDVGYIAALVEEIQDSLCIDTRRVYATGMSNGAYLSHRIACEYPGRLAAIAPVVGSLSTELGCADGRAIPVLQLSGSEDSLASREESVAHWVSANGCDGSTEQSYQQGAVTCTTHRNCDEGVEVTHCVVDGGGHCFYSDAPTQFTPGCGPRDDIVSQELIWEFLSRWRLP